MSHVDGTSNIFPGQGKITHNKNWSSREINDVPVDSNSAYLRLLMAGESNRINAYLAYATRRDAASHKNYLNNDLANERKGKGHPLNIFIFSFVIWKPNGLTW